MFVIGAKPPPNRTGFGDGSADRSRVGQAPGRGVGQAAVDFNPFYKWSPPGVGLSDELFEVVKQSQG